MIRIIEDCRNEDYYVGFQGIYVSNILVARDNAFRVLERPIQDHRDL